MIKRLLILVLTINTYVCYAQDIHTTQLNEHDYLYNPGLVGNYHGNSRVQFSTRSQWSSINNAYQTYSFSTDYKLGVNKWDKGNLGIGIAANSDKSGNNFLSNNTVNLGVSGLILLSEHLSMSMGILSTYNQSKIDPSNILWGNQYNGEYHNPNAPSGESFNPTQFSYFNFASGIVFTYGKSEGYMALYDQTHLQIGVSGYNLNTPNMFNGFLVDSLYRRFCLFGKGFIGIPHSRTGIVGSLLVQKQGPNLEIMAGAFYRIRIKEASKITGYNKESAIALGGYWRYGDALCPGVLFEIKDYAIGITYDLTASKLLPATNTMGAVEITFRMQSNNQFLYKGYNPK